jgi:hypothetical protein
MLPAMIETALQPYVSAPVAETETATPQAPSWLSTVEAFVSDMTTDTDTDTAASAPRQESAAPSVSDTDTDTETETLQPSRVAAPGETPVADTATVAAMEAGAGDPPHASEEGAVADTETAAETATVRPRSSKYKITPTQEVELRAKRSRGVPIKTLMQEYGLSKATVHRYLAAPPGA